METKLALYNSNGNGYDNKHTGSANRLYKKGWTSLSVSGPPRFKRSTPILSSSVWECDSVAVKECVHDPAEQKVFPAKLVFSMGVRNCKFGKVLPVASEVQDDCHLTSRVWLQARTWSLIATKWLAKFVGSESINYGWSHTIHILGLLPWSLQYKSFNFFIKGFTVLHQIIKTSCKAFSILTCTVSFTGHMIKYLDFLII